jgi:hypothetical protein
MAEYANQQGGQGGMTLTQAGIQSGNPYVAAAAFMTDMALAGGRDQLMKAQNKYNQEMAAISNRLREKSNEVTAAWSATKQWQQSYNNNKRLQAGGEQVTTNTVNTLRSRDVRSVNDVQQAIADAEQRGVAYAAQAASGVTGSAADMINSTLSLRAAITKEQSLRTKGMVALDSAQRSGDIMRAAVSTLDTSYSQPEFDYSKDFAPLVQLPSPFMKVMSAVGGENIVKGASYASKIGEKDKSTRTSGWASSYDSGQNIDFGSTDTSYGDGGTSAGLDNFNFDW